MMLDRLRLSLRLAADFGVATIVIHAGNIPSIYKEHPIEVLHCSLLDSLRQLVPLAENSG
jgi:sugar phosphate isomerase/epimerase